MAIMMMMADNECLLAVRLRPAGEEPQPLYVHGDVFVHRKCLLIRSSNASVSGGTWSATEVALTAEPDARRADLLKH